jgi:hypothetical protein
MHAAKIAAALLFAIAAGDAAAQTAAEKAACRADYQKFCSEVSPGGGRVLECLAKQKDKLSPDCQKVVETYVK